jgi:hypothetical protein
MLGHHAVFAIENSADWTIALSDSAIHLRGTKAFNGLRGRFIMQLTGCAAMIALLIAALVSARAQAPVAQAPAVQKLATTLRGYQAGVFREDAHHHSSRVRLWEVGNPRCPS